MQPPLGEAGGDRQQASHGVAPAIDVRKAIAHHHIAAACAVDGCAPPPPGKVPESLCRGRRAARLGYARQIHGVCIVSRSLIGSGEKKLSAAPCCHDLSRAG
jgi:hypothetical protein